LSVAEKRNRVEADHPHLSIQRQCGLLDLCRSSFYRNSMVTGQESPENLELMRAIDKEYTDHPFYGSRQMRNILRRQGYKINRKRVQRLMRRMGLQSSCRCPQTWHEQTASGA